MEIRRTVQFTGGSSFSITLPKEWAMRMGIRRGSTVVLKTLEDGSVVVYPEKERTSENHEVEILLGPHVSQMILGAYLYGYNTIRIKSAMSMDDTELANVKKAVRGLAGAEIVDETPTRVEIQVVLDRELVAPEKLLRRQHTLVLGMVENSVDAYLRKNNSLAKLVVQRDEEVDRLYFTLVRTIRSAIVDPTLAKRLEASPLLLMDLRVAAKFIEDAGDQSAEIAKEALKNVREIDEDLGKDLKQFAQLITSMGTGPVDAFFSQDMEKITKITSVRTDFQRRGDAFLKKAPQTQALATMFKVYSHLARICEDLADTAELGLPFKPPS
ncbi:MAG: AbrB/MazE/SpoVT family DNA-binding domain-containing protein [Candidatus Caldarchaeum sp.]|nr:AbrB/MazE/SpoVT family DNA-binding domain-containing protein [Candidatus Caldarchaeum sp.]